jgi:hypothetical protein
MGISGTRIPPNIKNPTLYGVHTSCRITTSSSNYPTLTLPLQRGGNNISSFPPLQGGIKGGNSRVLGEIKEMISMEGNQTSLYIIRLEEEGNAQSPIPNPK